MPTLNYRVEAPGVNILKTVTETVVNGFLDELDLSLAFKDQLYLMSSFWAISQYANQDGTPTLIKNRCDVEASFIMDKTQVPWPVDSPYTTPAYGIRSSSKGHHTPIFLDEKAGILIEHQTSACAIDLNFTMTFGTFDEATKAFDTIKSRYTGTLISTPFDLNFSYPVSMGMLKFLTAAYQAKTDYKTKTFLDYIKDMQCAPIGFDARKTQLLQNDGDKELMIRCQQLNCLAQVTMEQKEPEVTRIESLPDTYIINLTMVIQFGRPTLVEVHTPISIDNTVLPEALFENTLINFHYNPMVAGVYQDLVCNDFARGNYGNYSRADQIARIPLYDDWYSADAEYAFYKYRPFLIAHFTLDGPVTTFNLNDLAFKLHPVVQAIMKETGSRIFDYGGLFNLSIFADNLRLGTKLVSIDADLNVTITSNRLDKVYHLVISETTNLFKTDPIWDYILVKYRYFFPLTIERNLANLVKKRYFYIANDTATFTLISRLQNSGKLKSVLDSLISLGETDNQIYAYTQSPAQLADYMAYTQSKRDSYHLPTGDDPQSVLVRAYYDTKASVYGRSVFVAFMEECLINGYISLDYIPNQYLEASPTVYPYYASQGGYYGFNTPIRIFQYTIDPKQPTQ